ncbi:CocE/NonD family hydrolase [Thermodesulfobacteriota bacterium]
MAEITVERNVDMKMRDGTILRGDVYRPAEGGPFPVLLHRLPYNKSYAWIAAALMLNPLNGADQGYAVVLQDCRGRFESEGEWTPFHSEIDDGYDTVEWCAEQPWSNGKVGIYGSSYMGVTGWQAVAAAPPHLEAAFIYLTGANYHEGWVYTGGAFELGFNLWYSLFLGWDKLFKLPEDKQGPAMQKMFEAASNLSQAYQHLPLKELPVFEDVAPFYYDWLAHPSYDEYWQEVNVEARCDKITVPVLQMTGWFDNFLIGHLNTFRNIREQGGTDKARENQKIIIGPWTHENYLSLTMSKVGDMECGVVAMPNAELITFRWFDHWLKDVDTGMMDEPPVRIFVTGANEWRDEEDWPLERAKETAWYLHSGGQANTLDGDGALTLVPPDNEPTDTYAYDPSDPVPTVGGRTLMPGVATDGFRDQRCVEERPDVLVYTSPMLMKDTEVTGPVVLKLWAASSCRDTDFTAKLVDVHPDGYAAIVADGILRARYRESLAQPKLLEPGQIYELTIDLWATSLVFKNGHRIRVEVSSSNFPRFDRNLNTGEDNAGEAQMQTAIQTIYHDAKHPSHIVLPIVE